MKTPVVTTLLLLFLALPARGQTVDWILLDPDPTECLTAPDQTCTVPDPDETQPFQTTWLILLIPEDGVPFWAYHFWIWGHGEQTDTDAITSFRPRSELSRVTVDLGVVPADDYDFNLLLRD